MATTCCVCQLQLSNELHKNIFKDDLVIRSTLDKSEETSNDKIRLAIELITGRKVFEAKGSSSDLCDQCFQKLQDFMNFRAQILKSFKRLFEEENFSNSSNSEIKNSLEFFKDSDDFIDISDCPKLPDNQMISDDLINVDENSGLFDLSLIRNDDDNTNDFANCDKSLTNQRNNNLDSESSNDNIDVQNFDEIPTRILNNDIESDIDVCSGEDDEILEIEPKIIKENIKEIENSSDSDIEVCDYEPIGKRTKSLNPLYSAINI